MKLHSPSAVDPSLLASLLGRIDGGDEGAFRSLFDHTRATLARVVGALVPRESDVDEILLTVYEQVWKQAGRYDAALGSARTWLVVIARSRALDFLRAHRNREARREKGTLEASLETEFSKERDPAEETARKEERDRVHFALDELSAHQRQTIRVVFFEGLSHSEAAERLHIPLGTVKSRVRRGLEALEIGLRAREGAAPHPHSLPAEDRAS